MPARHSRQILRLRVSIVGIEPEIWRTIDVDENLTLADLHPVLQVAFNWSMSHLHRFSDGDPWGRGNGIPRIGRKPRAWVDAWSLTELGPDAEEEDESQTTVGDAMLDGGPLWYVYDSGDNWVHRIDVIDRDDARIGEPPAQVVAGERRAPFEDSGGVDGYEDLVAILADPSHPEHRSATTWVATTIGPWGLDDLEEADLDGARGDLRMLFGEGSTDMSGLVDAANGVTDESPIVDLASALPVPVRSNLRRHLQRRGLLTPGSIREEDAADAVRPFAWLIDRIGNDGVTLTKAGWMPPAVVLDGMTTLGWRDDWIGEVNREDLTYPMRELRASAERLRLIRKVRGRLELVRRTRPAVGTPTLLAEQIARGLLRQRMTDGQRIASTILAIGLADGSVTRRRDGERQVIGILNELGYADSQGRLLDQRWFSSLTEPVMEVFGALGLWRSEGRGRDVPVTGAVRAIACLALK
jgi:hypothetical protein